jgi:hypothetical protein
MAKFIPMIGTRPALESLEDRTLPSITLGGHGFPGFSFITPSQSFSPSQLIANIRATFFSVLSFVEMHVPPNPAAFNLATQVANQIFTDLGAPPQSSGTPLFNPATFPFSQRAALVLASLNSGATHSIAQLPNVSNVQNAFHSLLNFVESKVPPNPAAFNLASQLANHIFSRLGTPAQSSGMSQVLTSVFSHGFPNPFGF